MLYCSNVVPGTQMAAQGGFSLAKDGSQITALSVGNPFGWSITELVGMGTIGVIVCIGITALVVIGLRKRELSA